MGQSISQPGPPGTKFRVIGAGMSRTGTKTLNQALNILLKGPVHDSGVQSTGGTDKQIAQWIEVMEVAPHAATSFVDKKHLDYLLADLLTGYIATMDCPAALVAPEILDVFPDAVVIATTRDPKSWWKSMQAMQKMTSNWYLPLLVMWVPRIGTYGIWREKFKGMALWRYGEDMFTEDTIEKHEAFLRRAIPEEKLFWYEVKQGWEPLCKILGLPVPDVPFPHNNSLLDAQETYNDLIKAGIFTWAIFFTVTGTIGWLIWKWRGN